MKIHTKIITSAILIAGLGSGSYYTYNEFNKLEDKNRKLADQVNELSGEIANKDKLIIKKEIEIGTLQTGNKELNDKVNDLNKTIENKNTSIHNLKQQLEKATKRNESPTDNSKVINTMTMELSFYTNDPREGGGYGAITKSGFDVSNTIKYQGMGIAASDNKLLPLYSIIEIEGLGRYIILDSGGKIKGKTLDILVATREEAFKKGRYNAKVNVIRYGKGG